jgi:hypothetical protein
MLIALVVGETFVVTIWWFKSEIKTFENYSAALRKENSELKEALLKHLTTPTSNDKAKDEQTITKVEEFETDDATYNRVLQEWIYGATEDKKEEGGLDG